MSTPPATADEPRRQVGVLYIIGLGNVSFLIEADLSIGHIGPRENIRTGASGESLLQWWLEGDSRPAFLIRRSSPGTWTEGRWEPDGCRFTLGSQKEMTKLGVEKVCTAVIGVMQMLVEVWPEWETWTKGHLPTTLDVPFESAAGQWRGFSPIES